MVHQLYPWRFWLLGLLAVSGAVGCVERRMVVQSDPPGAIVYDEKNQPIGGSTADKPFTFYGKYTFRLVKDGYETLVVDQPVKASWYEWPGLDFISENLIPWTIRDVRYFKYAMQPANTNSQNMDPEVLLQQAQALREYSATKGTAPLPPPPALGPPPPGLMAPAGR